MATKELLLYNHPLSSYAQKVRMVLREKGIPFKTIAPTGITAGEHDTAFQQANPRLEVPTLVVDENLSIFDSTIILEYLEEQYPTPKLMPADPAGRARTRMIEDICDTHYEAVNWGLGEIQFFDRATGELAEKLRDQAQQQTRVILEWLADQIGSKQFFNGDEFGSADICVAPYLNRSKYFGCGPEAGSPLDKWLERIQERESIKVTFAEFDGAAAKMREYAPVFMSGQRKREYRDHRLEWMIKSGGLDVVLEGMKANNIRFSWP